MASSSGACGAPSRGSQGTAGAGAGSQPPRYLRSIGLALLMLQPGSVPGFAYAYLEVLSHRCFMPRLLMAPGGAGWPLFEALLLGLLSFLEPALRAAELAEPLRLLELAPIVPSRGTRASDGAARVHALLAGFAQA